MPQVLGVVPWARRPGRGCRSSAQRVLSFCLSPGLCSGSDCPVPRLRWLGPACGLSPGWVSPGGAGGTSLPPPPVPRPTRVSDPASLAWPVPGAVHSGQGGWLAFYLFLLGTGKENPFFPWQASLCGLSLGSSLGHGLVSLCRPPGARGRGAGPDRLGRSQGQPATWSESVCASWGHSAAGRLASRVCVCRDGDTWWPHPAARWPVLHLHPHPLALGVLLPSAGGGRQAQLWGSVAGRMTECLPGGARRPL